MLFEHPLAGYQFPPETVHGKMERRIIVFDRPDQIPDPDLRIKLLRDLSLQRLLRTFSLFDLSARKFPTILELSVSPLGRENDRFVFFVDRFYHRCCYPYCFQRFLSPSLPISQYSAAATAAVTADVIRIGVFP